MVKKSETIRKLRAITPMKDKKAAHGSFLFIVGNYKGEEEQRLYYYYFYDSKNSIRIGKTLITNARIIEDGKNYVCWAEEGDMLGSREPLRSKRIDNIIAGTDKEIDEDLGLSVPLEFHVPIKSVSSFYKVDVLKDGK